MTSNQFTILSNDIESEKNKLDSIFNKLLSSMDTLSQEQFNKIYSQGINFFSKFETFITSCSSEEENLSDTQVNDILISVENILEYAIKFFPTMKEVAKKFNINLELQDNFLHTSQVVLKTYKKDKVTIIKNGFIKNKIPIKGFESKDKYKLKSLKIDWVSLSIGIILLLVSGLLVFKIDISTGMQYYFSRILISLSISLIFTGIAKNKIQAKFNLPKITITAVGTITVFLILYLVNPAEIPTIK